MSSRRNVEQVHNRMPTILNEELAWEWMMDDISEERMMGIAATQYPTEMMDACFITKDFLASLDPTTPFIYEDLLALELLA